MVAECMCAYGVRHVVTSPGSRNAPLIMAFARREEFVVHSVVDERSAAFIALGMAGISGEPVALVCTSGTALLNYAPALAEAYYRHIPLVAISADRPSEWIDQNDSQTLRQPAALENVVRSSISLKGEISGKDELWYTNRMLNDVMDACMGKVRGPVHINISLGMPLTGETNSEGALFRKIDVLGRRDVISTSSARQLAASVAGKKILVVATVNAPDSRLSHALGQLASLPNVAVIAEGLSNIHARGVHSECDMLFSGNLKSETVDELKPDVLICYGGAAVSAPLKQFLRGISPSESWYVGVTDHAIDCYMSLTARIDVNPEGFFPRFASSLAHLHRVNGYESDYADTWREYASVKTHDIPCNEKNVWNASGAVEKLLSSFPSDWNIQLSNGMTVRHALMCSDLRRFHRVDCNRGVSGIDGSTSTAVGASAVYSKPTVLLTGDMSMQYDIGALGSGLISPRLKIVVFSNGGGGIFKVVKTTRDLAECDKYFACGLEIDFEKIAEAYGFRYMCVRGFEDLDRLMPEFIGESARSVIMEIATDADTDAAVYLGKLK